MGKRGRQLSGQWNALFSEVQRAVSRFGGSIRTHAAPATCRRMGQGPAHICARCQGTRNPRFVRQGSQRHCEEPSLAHGRLGRLVSIDQDAAHLRRRGRFRSGPLQRAQLPLRHSRARHGRDRQRHGAVENPRLRFDLPHLQRLHEDADPPLGHHGGSRNLDLHPRFHRRRRRRTDPPADRATGHAARGSRPDHAASRRRQRSRRSVESNHDICGRSRWRSS